MSQLGPFMRATDQSDASLASHWSWIVPSEHKPLLLSIFGDWVFGAPDGSHWLLSTLEGCYECVAKSGDEFNRLKQSFEWLDAKFLASWQEIAARHGIVPSPTHCIAWRVSPALGGPFSPDNLQLLPHKEYQPAMSLLHQRILASAV